MAKEKEYIISICKSVTSNIVKVQPVTWDNLIEALRHPQPITNKHDVPLFSPAEFVKGKRSKDNVTNLSLFVLDFDNPQVRDGKPPVTMDDVCQTLVKKELKHALASSWSNTDKWPKFRIILPLAYPIHKKYWAAWAKAALEACGLAQFSHAMDTSCLKNVAVIFFFPSAPDGDPTVIQKPGKLLDVPIPTKGVKLDFSHIRFHQPEPMGNSARGDYATLDVIKWFDSHGHYIKPNDKQARMHYVLCPWADEHTSKKPGTATIVIEAGPGPNQWPSFSCFHSHCARRGIKDVIEAWPDAVRFCAKPWIPSQNDVAVARGEAPGGAAKVATAKTITSTALAPGQPAGGSGGTSATLGKNAPLPSDGNVSPYIPNLAHECKDGFPSTVVELVKRYVYVSGMDKILDRKTGGFMSCSGLRNTIASTLFETEGEGWRHIDYFKLHGHRKCTSAQIVFDPTKKVDFPRINIFTGFCHDAAAPFPTDVLSDKVEAILLLLHYLCGDDAEYVLKWLAYPLIYPGSKMRSSLIIHGAQGLGKNLLFERAMIGAYGRWSRLIDQRDLDSTFNGWISKKLFIVADEVATDKRKTDTSNLLKSWITGGTVSINEKNLPIREEANHCNFVFLSNHVVPIFVDEDDRRYCVIRVPEAPMDPGVYLQVVNNITETKGLAWYQYLRSINVSREFIREPVPRNKAKAELKQFCRGSVDLYLNEWACIDEDTGEQDLEAAREGRNDMRIPYGPAAIAPLYHGYRAFCKWNGITYPVSKRSFGIRGPNKREYVKGRTREFRYVIPPEVIIKNHWDVQNALDAFDAAVITYTLRRPEGSR